MRRGARSGVLGIPGVTLGRRHDQMWEGKSSRGKKRAVIRDGGTGKFSLQGILEIHSNHERTHGENWNTGKTHRKISDFAGKAHRKRGVFAVVGSALIKSNVMISAALEEEGPRRGNIEFIVQFRSRKSQ